MSSASEETNKSVEAKETKSSTKDKTEKAEWVTSYVPKNSENATPEKRDVYKGGQGGYFYYSNNQVGGRKVYVQVTETTEADGKITYTVTGAKRKRTKEQTHADERRRIKKKARKLMKEMERRKRHQQQKPKSLQQLIMVSGPADIEILPLAGGYQTGRYACGFSSPKQQNPSQPQGAKDVDSHNTASSTASSSSEDITF